LAHLATRHAIIATYSLRDLLVTRVTVFSSRPPSRRTCRCIDGSLTEPSRQSRSVTSSHHLAS
jgi:hypothetical protein